VGGGRSMPWSLCFCAREVFDSVDGLSVLVWMKGGMVGGDSVEE